MIALLCQANALVGEAQNLKALPTGNVERLRTRYDTILTEAEAEAYRPAFNAEFMPPVLEEGSAFVPWIGGKLDDFLCETFERVVGKDNCVAFEGMALQVPKDRHRMHYRKVKVRGHC